MFVRLLSILLICLVCTVSCTSESTENNDVTKKLKQTKTTFLSDTIFVTNVFPEFESNQIPLALSELGFCSLYDSLKGNDLSPCSDQLFRVFPLDTIANFGDGFLLDVRRGALRESNSKSLIVISNHGGKYKIVNFFKGKLLERRTTRSGKYDLLMEYRAEGLTKIAVKHVWNSSSMAYIPVDVEEINAHYIKEALKDSINEIYLKQFVWGY